MVVDNSTFSDNGKAGLKVCHNGMLILRNSRMSNNRLDGLLIGLIAAKCDAFD